MTLQTRIPRYARELGFTQLGQFPHTITTGAAPHSLCVNEALGLLAVSCANMPGMQLFSLIDGSLVATISTAAFSGSNPLGIRYAFGSWWLADYGATKVHRIDGAGTSWSITSSITCGLGPRDVIPDATGVWVTESNAGTISRINPSTNAIDPTTTLTLGGTPYRGDFDAFQYLYVVDTNGAFLWKINTTAVPPTATKFSDQTSSNPWGVQCTGQFIMVSCLNSGGGGAINKFLLSGTCLLTWGYGQIGNTGEPHEAVIVRDEYWVADANGNRIVVFDLNAPTHGTADFQSPIKRVIETKSDTAGMAMSSRGLVFSTAYTANVIEAWPIDHAW